MTLSVERRGYTAPIRALDAALARVARGRLPLTVEWLRGAAERATGLTDWGDEGVFGAPMRLLLEDLEEGGPSMVGRVALRGSLLKAATNRLRVRAASGRRAALRPPIVIVGLHRTGTTLLQHLLGALPDHRFLPMWSLMSPAPGSLRRLSAYAAVAGSRLVGPEMWRIHPVYPRGPEECWMLFLPTFRVFDYALHWRIPRYTAWLDACDMRPAYGEYRDTLALLEAEHAGTPVMKGPSHLHGLDALLDVLPDARVIWTHRDPVRAVASFGSLSAVHHRTMYGAWDPNETGRRTLDRFHAAVTRAMAALDRFGEDRVVHVPYAALAADPIGTVRRMAQRWGVPFDEGAGRAAMADMPRLPHHAYSAAQWGLDPGEVRERFRAYTERFDVPAEP